jgi:hypothetical protein
MMNRVGNGHAWAALLLLAAACDGGGGGGGDEDSGRPDGAILADAETDAESDGETPEDEGGGPVEEDSGADPDAGDSDGSAMDADTADTGTETDTGTGDTGAGTDTGTNLPTGCAETAITASAGGSVTSTDSRFTLTLAGGQLSADSTVRVCVVAAASAPSTLDGRLGDAYEITSTGGATFSASTATFRGHSALPAVDATAAFDPPIVRALPTGGSVANGTGAVLRMSKRTAAADTVTTLSATVAGPGHVYVGSLEAAGVYQVDMHTPTKTAFVTGEIIDFSTIVTVTGTPAGSRIFEAEVNGCNLDPVNYASTVGDVRQPAFERNNPNCPGRNYVAIRRVGGPGQAMPGSIVGGTNPSGAVLTGGTTLDLRAHNSTPLSLYCRHPGSGSGAARLFFKTGTTTNLEIVKDIEVACTFSGDWIEIYDQVDITRSGTGGFVVGTTYTPRSYIAIAPPSITYTAVAPDGVRFAEPAAVLSGSAATATFSGNADIESGMDPPGPLVHTPTNAVTFTYGTDRYTAALATPTPGFFELRARAHLHIRQGGNTLFDCYPASSADMALQTGPRAGASSTVSTLDGTIDVISIRARFPGSGGATIVQRWVDATRLTSQQAVPLLTGDQQTALASLGTASEYAVGLYRVVWDEQRRLWDGGRILPVACGTTLLFEAADVAP